MKNYFASSSDQDEEGMLIEAENVEEARLKLLQELGWYLIETEEDVE